MAALEIARTVLCKRRDDSFCFDEDGEAGLYDGAMDEEEEDGPIGSTVVTPATRTHSSVSGSGTGASEENQSWHANVDRREAMEMATKHAAIREQVLQEMRTALGQSAFQPGLVAVPGPGTVRSSSFGARDRQRGPAAPRRSLTPQRRNSLRGSSSFGRQDSFRQNSFQVVTAQSWTQPSNVVGPAPERVVLANAASRTNSFEPASRAVLQSSSHSRSNSLEPPNRAAALHAGSLRRRPSFDQHQQAGKHAVGGPSTPQMSGRPYHADDPQGTLAARLNMASELIDGMSWDEAMLQEASHIPDVDATVPMELSHSRPRNEVTSSQGQRQPTQTTRGRTTRSRSTSVFWKPPPEAAFVCEAARNPSFTIVDSARPFYATPAGSTTLRPGTPRGTRENGLTSVMSFGQTPNHGIVGCSLSGGSQCGVAMPPSPSMRASFRRSLRPS